MTDIGNKEVFARNLLRYMEITGKNRADVCNDLGFPYSTFSEWCQARKYPRIDKIEKMAEYFGCLKSDLIEDKTKKLDTMTDAEFSENRKKLMKLIEDCPEDKAARLLQVLKLFLDSDKSE